MLLRNTAWGVLGELATRAARMAQVVLIARVLGAEELGRFNYALALASLCSVMFDFGVLQVVVKELAHTVGGSALRTYGRIKLFSSFVGLILVGAVALIVQRSPADRCVTFALGIYLALSDFSNYVVAVYRVRREFWRETLLRAVMSAIQLAACAATLLLTHRLGWIAVALVLSAVVGLVPLAREWVAQPLVAYGDRGLAGMARSLTQCVPIAGTVLVGTVYMNFDVTVLGHSASLQEVGWYSVAVKTIFSLVIMPLVYFQLATLPAFAAGMGADCALATRDRWLRGFALSTTAGALLSFATAASAKELLVFLFGNGFSAGAPVLTAFTLIGFLFYLYTPLSQWLLLQGKQKWSLYIQLVALAVNLLLVLLLVPHWGIWGAVAAAGGTHLTIAVGHFVAVWVSGDFSGKEAGWSSVLRSTLGITLGVAVLRFGIAFGVMATVTAIALFAACAHREIMALAPYFRMSVRHLYRNLSHERAT